VLAGMLADYERAMARTRRCCSPTTARAASRTSRA
jgi:hypothetical protein